MSARLTPPRVLGCAALWVTAALGAFGCAASPGGPQYSELGIRTEDTSTNVLSDECTPLPVLPGGTVVRDFSLAPNLSAHVLAVRDSAEVTLEGTTDASSSHRTFPQPELYAGFTDALDVTTTDGELFKVSFYSPCQPSISTP